MNAGTKEKWDDLVRREPRLADLLNEARAVTSRGDPHFCANAVWFGYPGSGYPGLKPRLVELVGWEAESGDPVLHTEVAYDVAYHTVYDALPTCRRCGCL